MDSAGFSYFGQGKLVCKSSASADNGKTVSVTSASRSFSKVLAEGVAEFTLPGKNKYHIKLMNSSVTEFEADIVFGFGEYKEIEVGMNKTTWTGLKNIVNAHLESTYCTVGDEISETLNTGEVLTYRIAAIDHDKSHQLIFEPRYCLETARQVNTTNVNSGGWSSCALRQWLNATFYSELSDELKGVITPRSFKTSIGNQSTSLQEATDNIWLPKEWEVFGTTSYATATEHTGDSSTAQFAIYATASNRVKTFGKTGSSAAWWLSSPNAGGSTAFCDVDAAGSAGVANASNSYGVVPCFQIVSES